jgi:hypothetical protein
MASPRRYRIAHIAPGFGATLACLAFTGQSLASQGPGGGPGAAGGLTQIAMAIIVYGTSALVVGAGLIGAARRRSR